MIIESMAVEHMVVIATVTWEESLQRSLSQAHTDTVVPDAVCSSHLSGSDEEEQVLVTATMYKQSKLYKLW